MQIHKRRHYLTQAALAFSALLCCATQTVHAQSTVIQKKFIEAGWDKPDTATLRANLAQMEQTPFDGVIIGVTGTDEAEKLVRVQGAFSNVPWKREWFQKSIDDLKAIRSPKLTDNFVIVGANPGNVDWFDDAGWKEIVDHWRIAAWIAREGGLKGILFDPEPYTKPFAQFDYTAQPGRDQHTLSQYQVKARQRGQEIIRAVAQEAPELAIFTFFMNSVNMMAANTPNPQMAVGMSSYSLYPGFINGWLDVAPPTMTFVDGCEHAYHFNSALEYFQAANDIRNTTLSLIAPENRAKYIAQVQASFGVYLDAYVNPPTSMWYIDPKGAKPVDRLRVNAQSAIQAANEYVWVYGEKYRWWPTPNKGVNPESWNDVLPGINEALLAATHPDHAITVALAEIQKQGTPVNLLQNGDFTIQAGAPAGPAQADWKTEKELAGWSTWQVGTTGTFSLDRTTNHGGGANTGAALLKNITQGCIIQSIAVKPGETYIVRARMRQKGEGPGWIRIRWQAPDAKWVHQAQDVLLMCAKSPAEGEWCDLSGLVTVPDDAGKLLVLLSAANQSPQDAVWFDDVQLFKTK